MVCVNTIVHLFRIGKLHTTERKTWTLPVQFRKHIAPLTVRLQSDELQDRRHGPLLHELESTAK